MRSLPDVGSRCGEKAVPDVFDGLGTGVVGVELFCEVGDCNGSIRFAPSAFFRGLFFFTLSWPQKGE